jgi:YihY family inner membrane protein
MRIATRNDAPVMEVRRRGLVTFLGDVVRRFRDADGMSHARALGYQGTFAMLSGFIGLLGLASVLGIGSLRAIVIEMSKGIAPGPSGQLLQEAARQSSGGGSAAVIGLGAALVSGALAMAQIERSGNRLAGRHEDRPGAKRFLVGLALALSAGVLAAVGLLLLAGGSAVATGLGWHGAAADVWMGLRWVIGIAVAGAGIYLLFRYAPERPLGSRRALLAGAAVALVLWVLFTIALTIWFALSSSAQTYGVLVSVIALLLWAGATSLALHLGMSVSAEFGGRGAAVVGRAAPDGVVELPDAPARRSLRSGRADAP